MYRVPSFPMGAETITTKKYPELRQGEVVRVVDKASTTITSRTSQKGSNRISGEKLLANIDYSFHRSGRWFFLQFCFTFCTFFYTSLIHWFAFASLRKLWEYLLDQFDTSGQVHAEVNKHPIDAFSLVLLLFEYKHMVIEELLQFLVGEVDAELLKAVVLLRLQHNARRAERDTAWCMRWDQV